MPAFSNPGIAHKSRFRIAKEATAGTAPASATAEYEISDFTLDPLGSVFESANIQTSGESARDIVQGPLAVTGSFGLDVAFEGCEELLRWAIGSYSAALVGGESVVRDHTFKEAALGALPTYTQEISVGDIPAGKVDRYVGSVCTAFDASVDGAGLLHAKCNFAAYPPVATLENITPMTGTTSVLNNLVIPWSMALRTTGNLKDGSGVSEASIFVRSMKLRLERPFLTMRPFLGSQWSDAPIRNGNLKATMELEWEWDALNYVLQSQMLTNAPAAGGLKILFQHPTSIGTGAVKREFELIASSPVGGPYGKQLPGPGAWTQRGTWALKYNTTDSSCIKIRTRSLTAALV